MSEMRAICGLAPVIPVLVVHDVATARPLAEALVAGGLPVLEVTLRTPAALAALRAMAAVPGAVVGAGTVLTPADLAAARAAGAAFGVAPGMTPALGAAVAAAGLPFLPGAATASEVMALAEAGFDAAKLFPAEAVGGSRSCAGLPGRCRRWAFAPRAASPPRRRAAISGLAMCSAWAAPGSRPRR